jgi:vacuolar fusion protein MON1
MNTIHSPSVLNSSAAATWIPVCLPKFNPSGFVNAYVNFLGTDDPIFSAPVTPANEDAPSDPPAEHTTPDPPPISGLALICVSAGGDFEAIRAWGDSAAQVSFILVCLCSVAHYCLKRLATDGVVSGIASHLRSGTAEYSVGALSVPGLRHFMYKSRSHVQLTCPRWEDPYEDMNDRRRVVTLYQTVHDAIHAKSGQSGGLKLQYIRTEKESVMGWVSWSRQVDVEQMLMKGL